MRRIAAVAAMFLLSGALPLVAASGLCATRPCCRSHHASVKAQRPCCTPGNCDVTANHDDATTAKVAADAPQFSATLIVVPDVVVATPRIASDLRIDTGPPTTRQRLAALSILLI